MRLDRANVIVVAGEPWYEETLLSGLLYLESGTNRTKRYC